MGYSNASAWARQIEIELRYAVADHGAAAVNHVIEVILDLVNDNNIDLDALTAITLRPVDPLVVEADVVSSLN